MSFRDDFLTTLKFTPTSNQEEAISLLDNFIFKQKEVLGFVLRGYAGTGKTTLIASLVNTLSIYRIRTVLLAPTGRAAKVLSSYSGKRANTCHRYIYICVKDEDGNQKFILRENKFKNTVFIVDEASMVSDVSSDGEIFSHRNLLEDLIYFIEEGDNCKLIFVGDTAQLPPVGSDISPALDGNYLYSKFGFQTFGYELNEVVRQALNSSILINASNLRYSISKQRLRYPYLKANIDEDFSRLDFAELEYNLRNEYSKHGIDEVVMVCRTNKYANLFNNQIRYRILDRENEIDSGDYIMCVKNNYFWLEESSPAGFIANGDILRIKKIIRYHEAHGYRFADIIVNLVDYNEHPEIELTVMLNTLSSPSASLTKEENNELYKLVYQDYAHIKTKKERNKAIKQDIYYNALQIKFAYCLTCHKAQGGQWNTVFLDQGYYTEEMHNIEYLRWLYTAVTRAKQKIFLTNFKEEFFQAEKEK